jgi:hypothetical protein
MLRISEKINVRSETIQIRENHSGSTLVIPVGSEPLP